MSEQVMAFMILHGVEITMKYEYTIGAMRIGMTDVKEDGEKRHAEQAFLEEELGLMLCDGLHDVLLHMYARLSA